MAPTEYCPALTSSIIGRRVESSKELSYAEAQKVLAEVGKGEAK